MDAADLENVQDRLDASLPYDDEAFCITVVAGSSRDDVLAAFGGDPSEPTLSLADSSDRFVPSVLLVERPDCVIVIEFNGFQGTREEVLTRASAHGRAGSIFTNCDAMNQVALAADGVVRFNEEVWDDLADDPETDDEDVRSAFAGLNFEFATWIPSSIVAVERFTGASIDGPRPPEPFQMHRIYPQLETQPEHESTGEDRSATTARCGHWVGKSESKQQTGSARPYRQRHRRSDAN